MAFQLRNNFLTGDDRLTIAVQSEVRTRQSCFSRFNIGKSLQGMKRSGKSALNLCCVKDFRS